VALAVEVCKRESFDLAAGNAYQPSSLSVALEMWSARTAYSVAALFYINPVPPENILLLFLLFLFCSHVLLRPTPTPDCLEHRQMVQSAAAMDE
jgi:hypothetical protein